ncbi:winged helix-turn-helix domain-containing protein [Halocatena marina]|uniref:Winged helix-turn-helix domain-containing protein n=1 Tax=Halocatena marina TaxID=2934937 RepID=A0ABD5YUK4_9EURY|nr:winged helix-turn-helix domain-containing protein [Halocatena marina]
MSRADIQECDECVSPAEAFSIIGNETRLSILEALWAVENRPVRFSRLRKQVGMRDSAQFNYHLDKLIGQFVVRSEKGYDLRNAGERVVEAVLAGSFNEHPRVEPFTIDSPCTRCDAPLRVYYEDEQLTVECPECDRGHGTYTFPPGGLHDRSHDELLTAFDQRVRHLHCLAADGVCPACSGRMRTTIVREDECCLGVDLRADHVCEQCNHNLCSAIGLSLLDHSAVVAFHKEHDIDLNSTPYWNFEWCVSDDQTTVLSEDPWRLRVDIPLDAQTLSVVLDGDLTVIETEHRH